MPLRCLQSAAHWVILFCCFKACTQTVKLKQNALFIKLIKIILQHNSREFQSRCMWWSRSAGEVGRDLLRSHPAPVLEQGQPEQVVQGRAGSDCVQGWRLHSLSGQPLYRNEIIMMWKNAFYWITWELLKLGMHIAASRWDAPWPSGLSLEQIRTRCHCTWPCRSRMWVVTCESSLSYVDCACSVSKIISWNPTCVCWWVDLSYSLVLPKELFFFFFF